MSQGKLDAPGEDADGTAAAARQWIRASVELPSDAIDTDEAATPVASPDAASGLRDRAGQITFRRPDDPDRQNIESADEAVANWICRGIDEALAELLGEAAAGPADAARPLAYSKATRQLLVRAWRLAAHLHHRAVTLNHLIAALEVGGTALDRGGEVGPAAARTGALVRAIRLNETAIEPAILALATVRDVILWVGESAKVAARRGAGSELLPEDFAAALHDRECDERFRRRAATILKAAARVGNTQSELVRISQHAESIEQSVSRYRSDTNSKLKLFRRRLRQYNSQLGQITRTAERKLDGLSDRLATANGPMQEQITRLEQRLAGGDAPAVPTQAAALQDTLDNLRERTLRIETGQIAVSERIGRMEGHVAGQNSKLAALPQLMRPLSAPRPIEAHWLVLAVASAIVLGAAAGIGLNYASTTGLLQQLASDLASGAAPR
jgi:hypothetical protein